MAYELLQSDGDDASQANHEAGLAGEGINGMEDTDAGSVHTKASDMWAFGMVTYVSTIHNCHT